MSFFFFSREKPVECPSRYVVDFVMLKSNIHVVAKEVNNPTISVKDNPLLSHHLTNFNVEKVFYWFLCWISSLPPVHSMIDSIVFHCRREQGALLVWKRPSRRALRLWCTTVKTQSKLALFLLAALHMYILINWLFICLYIGLASTDTLLVLCSHACFSLHTIFTIAGADMK